MDKKKIVTELKAKRTNGDKRREILADCDLPDKFEGLADCDADEIFAVIKSLRWKIHKAATEYNLSVAQRRRHAPRDKYMLFAGRNTTSLTLSRICLRTHCSGDAIEAQSLVEAAEKYEISRGRVYRFLKDAVDEGIILPSNQGVYAYTEEALEHQFENLLRLLCNPKTHELYKMLRLSYGLLEAAALQHDNDGYRESNPTTLSRVLKLVDE